MKVALLVPNIPVLGAPTETPAALGEPRGLRPGTAQRPGAVGSDPPRPWALPALQPREN